MPKQWKTEVVKLSDVEMTDNNPRIIDPASLQGLKASVGRFGLVELIIWNRTTNHIVGGHQRYAVLAQQGVIEAPMIVVEMSTEEEAAAALALNNPMIEGEFDEPIMELMAQVEGAAPDLFKAVRMDELRATLERSMPRPDDDSPPPNLEPEWDTECPCCGNKWKVNPRDILVIKESE
jgi:hypothetical protein